jgi:hypothetical protein
MPMCCRGHAHADVSMAPQIAMRGVLLISFPLDNDGHGIAATKACGRQAAF